MANRFASCRCEAVVAVVPATLFGAGLTALFALGFAPTIQLALFFTPALGLLIALRVFALATPTGCCIRNSCCASVLGLEALLSSLVLTALSIIALAFPLAVTPLGIALIFFIATSLVLALVSFVLLYRCILSDNQRPE